MKIAILSCAPRLYSTRRLIEAGEARGHELEIINPLHCYMNISASCPEIHYKDRILTEFDAVIPRIGASITFYGTAVLRQFEMMGTYTVNTSISITRSRDKLRALQVLSRKGVGLPQTLFAHSTKKSEDLIELAGGPPVIIKLLQGTQGAGVVLAETKKAAESVIDAFRNLDAYFLVQQFIGEAEATDIRCVVVGEKVVASMMRTGKEGEFRSNLHRGGTAQKVKITPEERKTAIDAAKALNIRVGGVDLLRSSSGPMVLEVNSSPGLEGIENTTGIDVASRIIEYIEKNAKPASPRSVVKA